MHASEALKQKKKITLGLEFMVVMGVLRDGTYGTYED